MAHKGHHHLGHHHKSGNGHGQGHSGEGYITVCTRFRPCDPGRGGESRSLDIDGEKGEINCSAQHFKYAAVFDTEDNASIFETIGRPLVSNVLEGYNGTLMGVQENRTLFTSHVGSYMRPPAAPQHMARLAQARRTPSARLGSSERSTRACHIA